MVIALIMLADYSSAQRVNQNVRQCGAALVSMQNPSYLKTTDQGMIVIELPKGWILDKSRPDLFYILKSGDTYESARTLMYIRVEALKVSLKQAVLNDVASFKSSCESSIIEDLKRPPLLEDGCEKEGTLIGNNIWEKQEECIMQNIQLEHWSKYCKGIN